jgi:hypothetical protein
MTRLAFLVALALVAIGCRESLLEGPAVTAVTDQAQTVLELRGLDRNDLTALKEMKWPVSRWQQLWRIQDPDVPQPPDASIATVPALAGSYVVTDRGIVFVPSAALKRATTYEWFFFPSEMPSRPTDNESRISWRRLEFINASVQIP